MKKGTKIILGIIIALVMFYPVYLLFAGISFRYSYAANPVLYVDLKIKTDQTQTVELYYPHNGVYDPSQLKSVRVLARDNFQVIHFEVLEQLNLKGLQFAFENLKDTVYINEINFHYGDRSLVWNEDSISTYFKSNDAELNKSGNMVQLILKGSDPTMETAIDFSRYYNKLVDRSTSPTIALLYAGIFSLFFFFMVVNADYSFTTGKFIIHDFYPALVSLTFVGLLCVPVFFIQFPVGKNVHQLEKRFRAEKPDFKLESLADYPENFTNYFNDNFGLRTQLIRANKYIHTRYLYSYWSKDKVILGKDGWLFIATENTTDYYRNINRFTEPQLAQIKDILEERSEWLKQNGITYYFMLLPMSSTIYPEYLPSTMRKVHPQGRLDQVYTYLKEHHTTVNLIDVRNPLLEEKKKRIVYFKTDFHWNVIGAFLGYQELLNRMRKDFDYLQPDDFANYRIKHVIRYDADLALMISLEKKYPLDQVIMTPIKPFKAHEIPAPLYPSQEKILQPSLVMVNDSSKNPTFLMFRDSYSLQMQSFISEHFSKSVYVWTYHFIPEIIRIEKPKIVVTELLERAMDDLLLKNPDWMKEEILVNREKIRMKEEQTGTQKKN